MASKKSSAVPKRPTAATLAPRDSRYFGRNFFQSSSPSPTRNTAPEAAATLRSIPKESVMRSAMLAPSLPLPALIASLPSTESSVWLPALHHLLAICVQRIVNNPLRCIDFVVVLKIQAAKPFRDGVQPRALRLLPQRVVGVRAIHDLAKQHQRRIPRQIVFLQNRLERTFFAMVAQFHGWDIKRHCSKFLRFAHHLLRRNKMKFRLRVHKFSDQPGARHAIDLYMFTRNPLHTPSLHIRDMNLLDAPDAPIWGMIPTRPASAREKVSRRRLPMAITKPANEEARVIALDKYAILDTDPEQFFDDLTLLASHVCNTPIALISLVDEDRQWFKSRVGLDASETSRDIAFCSTAILRSDVFVVPDALKDDRFRNNPLVLSDPHVRFYAGAPLINEDGYALGTLCVVDRAPRELAPDQREALKALSRLVLAQLEFRRNLILLKEALTDRSKEEHERQSELVHVQETLMRVMGLRQLPASTRTR